MAEGDDFERSLIMQSVVKEALKAMRPGKAVGENGLAVEIPVVLGVGVGGGDGDCR